MQLFEECGILTKREFLTELTMLEDEMHLQSDYDHYYPRYNSLISFTKVDHKFIASHPIDYLPSKDIYPLMEYDDEWMEFDFELFAGELKVPVAQQSFFQNLTTQQLDFENNDYYLTSDFDKTGDPFEKDYVQREWTIVHLDDHALYGAGVEKEMKKFYPNCKWFYFTYPKDALHFIEELLKEEETINVIITDIQHIGLDGYEFAKEVRLMEEGYHRLHATIIALTMQSEDHLLVQQGIMEKAFTKYLPKTSEGEKIAKTLRWSFEPVFLTMEDKPFDTW